MKTETAAIFKNERITDKQKQSSNYLWYKQKADFYEAEASNQIYVGGGQVSRYRRMKVNYDLFNNILDISELEHICHPFGAEQGELPAVMSNKDISSYRIKALIGMAKRRSLGYKLLAINPEALSRKKEEENRRISEYVIDYIMSPIRMEAEKAMIQEMENRDITEEEKQQLQEKMQARIAENTPERVKSYMKRAYKDPSEIQGHQILEWIKKDQDVDFKFNQGIKHAFLSAYEIYFIGIENKKAVLKVVNPIRFACQLSPDIDFIEDAEWCVAEYIKSASEISMQFELNNKELDEIYQQYSYRTRGLTELEQIDFGRDALFSEREQNGIPVKHIQFPGLRKVGFLTYQDLETGELFTDFKVDENYKLSEENGDISIRWEWIPATYEVWKIGRDIYKNMGLAKGQLKDVSNLYTRKLNYYGAVYDATNSQPTSPMDRLVPFQYAYNVIEFKVQLLVNSDEGKKILMNINAVPSDNGMTLEQWQYLSKATPYMFYNPDEEGMTHQDVNTIAKVLDLSLISDITKYMKMLEDIERQAGKSIGVTDPVLGQTATSEKVGVNNQNLIQTGHILEPYFIYHDKVKRNVLSALLETTKVAILENPDDVTLVHTLDDMTSESIKVDKELLNNNTLGLFIEDATMIDEVKQQITNLAHAAMQNQTIELSDVLKVIRKDSIAEAIEDLEVAEANRQEKLQQEEERRNKANIELENKREEFAQKAHEREKEIVILKEEERRKTVIQQQTILAMGFNQDKDMDGDGKLDILEVADRGVKAQIEIAESVRKDKELNHKIKDDEVKNNLKEKEILAKMAQKRASAK
jgi:hypothetical protein